MNKKIFFFQAMNTTSYFIVAENLEQAIEKYKIKLEVDNIDHLLHIAFVGKFKDDDYFVLINETMAELYKFKGN